MNSVEEALGTLGYIGQVFVTVKVNTQWFQGTYQQATTLHIIM